MSDCRPIWLSHQCEQHAGALLLSCDVTLSQTWTVLFGPSGSGKSTWLRLLAGLVPQQSGRLQMHGVDLMRTPAYRRGIALVEQSPALFPHLNVAENVAFSKAATAEHTEALLSEFHLGHLRRARIATLSGGERQRVAIARALASRPKLLLLDEVFTGMDADLRSDLIGSLRRYNSNEGLPILSVTHDVAEAFATAEEVLRMREGSIIAQGTAAEVLREERAELLRNLST